MTSVVEVEDVSSMKVMAPPMRNTAWCFYFARSVHFLVLLLMISRDWMLKGCLKYTRSRDFVFKPARFLKI